MSETHHAEPCAHAGGGDTNGGNFAAALPMIAELPLSPDEKAEAVRRLLAEQNAKGTP